MKPRLPLTLPALLALSLAANAFFALREHRAASALSASSHTSPTSSTSPNFPSSATSTPSATSDSSAPSIWQRLAQGDPAALASLRAAGWPDETLRLLTTALVSEHFRPGQDAHTPTSNNYWESSEAVSRWFPQLGASDDQLRKKQEAALKSALGQDYTPPELARPNLQGIPREKAAAVVAIQNDYAALRKDILATKDPSQLKQLPMLEREERADIARALSPQEFFEYELRNSITADELRYNTAAFEPTETEFRALFRIKNPLDEPAFNMDDSAARKLRKDTEAQLDVQARTVLSEARFQQFVLSRDAEYRRFYHLAQHLQLPAATTASLAYEIKADIDRRSRALDADPTATPAARQALSQEAEARLTAAFGSAGMEIYRLNSRYLDLLPLAPSERPHR